MYNVFVSPIETPAPKFQAMRKGMLVHIPFDKEIPMNRIYEELVEPREFQTIYEEVKDGLVWLSDSSLFFNESPSFITEAEKSFYRRICKYEELRAL